MKFSYETKNQEHPGSTLPFWRQLYHSDGSLYQIQGPGFHEKAGKGAGGGRSEAGGSSLRGRILGRGWRAERSLLHPGSCASAGWEVGPEDVLTL